MSQRNLADYSAGLAIPEKFFMSVRRAEDSWRSWRLCARCGDVEAATRVERSYEVNIKNRRDARLPAGRPELMARAEGFRSRLVLAMDL